MRIALLSPAVGTGNVGDHFIEQAIRRLLPADVQYDRLSVRRGPGAEEVALINAADCALVCGTNLYQRNWESALTPDVLAAVRVPVVPFGVGSSAASVEDRSVGPETRAMIRALHAACTTGSVRDRHSLAMVSDVGVRNVALTGCPVLFWSLSPAAPEVAPRRRSRVVVTARNWLMHRWPDNVDHPAQIALLRGILDQLSSDEIVFAIHEEYDERLLTTLGIPPASVLRSDRWQDYADLYSDDASVVLALRLHAGMMSVANGVPAVFVGHDTRTYAFCELLDLPYVDLFSPNAATECLSAIGRLVDGDVGAFSAMREPYGHLAAAMGAFMEDNHLPTRLTPASLTAVEAVR